MAVRIGSTGLFAMLLGCAEVAGIIGIVGCASPRLRLDAQAEPDGTSFQAAYTRWTRDGSVVSRQEFDTTLLVSATLRSRAFQRAYTDRYLKVYRVNDPVERTRIEQTELALPDTGLHFWVRTASHQDKLNDLTPAKGRWRIALITNGQGPSDQPATADSEVLPDEITPVTRGDAVEVALFDQPPDPYRRVWHLRFPPLKPANAVEGAPLPSTPRKLTLRFAGPEGKTDLVWLVE
jgi:hypothetical protein